jgi:hypothetical protein
VKPVEAEQKPQGHHLQKKEGEKNPVMAEEKKDVAQGKKVWGGKSEVRYRKSEQYTHNWNSLSVLRLQTSFLLPISSQKDTCHNSSVLCRFL